MSATLTDKEARAIERLRKAFSNIPDTLAVYQLDDSIFICKRGISSFDISEHVGYADPCAVITDVHDDRDFGAHSLRQKG